MSMTLVLAFWGLCTLLILVPGPDWAYTISASLSRRSILPTVSGLMLGYVALTAVVAAGLGVLVAEVPAVLSWVTVAGAGYLGWLGLQSLLHPAVPAAAGEPVAAGSLAAQLFRGAGVSGINPKALLLFLAILPQFTDPGGSWAIGWQIALLGLIHTLTCGVIYLVIGATSRSVLTARPAAARWVGRASGVAMLGIAAALLVEAVVTR